MVSARAGGVDARERNRLPSTDHNAFADCSVPFPMVSILGMASNRGRNLLNIHEQAPGGAELAMVVTNDASARVLDKATARDIPTAAVEREPGENRFEHEERVLEAIGDLDVDLVCLDGYMRILSGTFLDPMPTTLNVHPSLLPAFPGMDAWSDALEAGVRVTGCTVHVVTDATDAEGNVIEAEIDSGPIVTQEPVPVYEEDTTDTLKERVLYTGEFAAYPRAVEWFARDAVTVDLAAGWVEIDDDVAEQFPNRHVGTLDRAHTLRYGENPHQDAAAYLDRPVGEPSVVAATQLNPDAKGLSYNNLNDADAALSLVREFEEPAAAVIKHTNPAGAAAAGSLARAYERALATDPKSAFGGVVALNRRCNPATAERIVKSFKEIVIAPGFTGEAVEVLRERENLRLLDVGPFPDDQPESPIAEKDLVGGRLRQEADRHQLDPAELEIVTDRAPTGTEQSAMLFAWQVVKHVKSNAIVFADGTETVGIGAGQVSRIDAVDLAARKAETDAEGKDPAGAVMASDAFFPFPDNIERAAAAGITAVIQPGGSKRDEDVIAEADDHDMAMALTGVRCFRHD